MKKFILICFTLCFFFEGLAHAQIKTPKENIPQDIPANIHKEIERLYSSNPNERKEGALNLSKMGEQAILAVPFLIESLDDENWEVRDTVANALGAINDPRVIEALLVAVKDKNKARSRPTINALRFTNDPRATEVLIAMLKDDDRIIRIFAAETLGFKKDERTVEPLISALVNKGGNDPYETEDVRSFAAKALGKSKDKRALEPLLVIFFDDNELIKVRTSAAFALKELGWQPVNQKEQIRFLFATENWRELEKLGQPSMDFLIATLRNVTNTGDDTQAPGRAATALGELKYQPAVEPLLEAVKGGIVVVPAIIALGRIGDKRAVESLIDYLSSGEPAYVSSAADALNQINDKRAIAPLIKALNFRYSFSNEETKATRISVAWALKHITGKDFGLDQVKWREWWENNKK